MFQPEGAIEYLRRHEGVVNYMYLDVAGLVTIGVGFLLPNPDSVTALELIRRDTGAPAAEEEKRDDWEAIHARPKAEVAANYRPFTRLDMPDAAIDRVLSARVADFVRNLRSRFPKFPDFPETAQIGLIDMAYSLGAAGLFRGFPKFCLADREDWAACAQEGSRGNVSEARNQELQGLFLAAAES